MVVVGLGRSSGVTSWGQESRHAGAGAGAGPWGGLEYVLGS